MECFSYKTGYGVSGCMHIETLKKELAWATGRRLQVISNIKLFKSYTTKKLKNKAT